MNRVVIRGRGLSHRYQRSGAMVDTVKVDAGIVEIGDERELSVGCYGDMNRVIAGFRCQARVHQSPVVPVDSEYSD